jgi:hypothetical protein
MIQSSIMNGDSAGLFLLIYWVYRIKTCRARVKKWCSRDVVMIGDGFPKEFLTPKRIGIHANSGTKGELFIKLM